MCVAVTGRVCSRYRTSDGSAKTGGPSPEAASNICTAVVTVRWVADVNTPTRK